MRFPDRRLNVDVELDLVSIGIGDVDAVGHAAVIGHPDDPDAARAELVERPPQLVVALSDLQTEMV